MFLFYATDLLQADTKNLVVTILRMFLCIWPITLLTSIVGRTLWTAKMEVKGQISFNYILKFISRIIWWFLFPIRKISCLNRDLTSRGIDLKTLWLNIDDVIVKTVISAVPILKHSYNACFKAHDYAQACFEILGFDVLIDAKLKPYVLEVIIYIQTTSNAVE